MRRKATFAVVAVAFILIEQLSDDSGPTADRLHGFSGRAFGVSPIVTYTTKIGKSLLDLNARFIPEFANEKRVQGTCSNSPRP